MTGARHHWERAGRASRALWYAELRADLDKLLDDLAEQVARERERRVLQHEQPVKRLRIGRRRRLLVVAQRCERRRWDDVGPQELSAHCRQHRERDRDGRVGEAQAVKQLLLAVDQGSSLDRRGNREGDKRPRRRRSPNWAGSARL